MKFLVLSRDSSGSLIVSKNDLHHLKVLRFGDEIELPGLFGSEKYSVKLRRIKRDYEVLSINPDGMVEHGKTILYLPLIETSRLEWCLEKATELGINEFQFYYSDRTADLPADLRRVNSKMDRFQQKVLAACQQSGNLDIPILREPRSLREIMEEFPAENSGHIFGLGMGACECVDLKNMDFTYGAFLVGPEGDFSEREYEEFRKYPFLVLKKLRPDLVLRSETAAVYLASLNHFSSRH